MPNNNTERMESDTLANTVPYIISGLAYGTAILAGIGYMIVSGCSCKSNLNNVEINTPTETTIEETTIENDNGFSRTRG